MSGGYNDRLKPIAWKGECGDKETEEPRSKWMPKAAQLAEWIKASKHTVAFTGAGISCASGIRQCARRQTDMHLHSNCGSSAASRVIVLWLTDLVVFACVCALVAADFRGPKGECSCDSNALPSQLCCASPFEHHHADPLLSLRVTRPVCCVRAGVWTLEKKGEKPQFDVPFEKAKPSFTHMALVALMQKGYLHYIVSQNVDGLHLRSGVPRAKLSELHGNIFAEYCDRCNTEYVRDFDIADMGCKPTGRMCDNGACGGPLRGMTIDWDSPLPDAEFDRAIDNHKQADLAICLVSQQQYQNNS